MTHHENQAIRFLKANLSDLKIEHDMLMQRRQDLEDSLSANNGALVENERAQGDIQELLDAVDPSTE